MSTKINSRAAEKGMNHRRNGIAPFYRQYGDSYGPNIALMRGENIHNYSQEEMKEYYQAYIKG